MTDFVTCYRFSKQGFKPQFQSHLLEHAKEFYTEEFIEKNFPVHLRKFVFENMKKAYCSEFDFNGVFVFTYKPSKTDYKFYLNHLKDKPSFKEDLHIIQLPSNTICYNDDGFCFRQENRKPLSELIGRPVYIPAKNIIF